MRLLRHCLLQEWYTAMILILPLLWEDTYSQFFPGFEIRTFRKVTIQTGLCVHIPCSFMIPNVYTLTRNIQGMWYKGDDLTGKVVAINDGFEDIQDTNGRFFLTGEVWKGDCSLRISNARPEDSEYYTFRIQDRVVQHSFTEIKPVVEVIELTDKPEISMVKRIVVGEETTLTCTSPGRCSGMEPHISWEGNTYRKNIQKYTVNYEDGTRTYHANITFIPSIKDDQSSLTCKVNFVYGGITSKTIILDVEDKPFRNLPTPGPTSRHMPNPVCKSMDSKIIGGIVAGNIVILFLISLGIFCFLKRHMEKRQAGNGRNGHEPKVQGTESTYQDLIGQKNDIYDNINML